MRLAEVSSVVCSTVVFGASVYVVFGDIHSAWVVQWLFEGYLMEIVPVELKEANAFIESLHRHHKRVQGHRFSIGVQKDGVLVGVATVGRPVARKINPKEVLEVTRLCTDGTKNACSVLYSAAARIGKELGYKRIQTYILETENGASLKASNWSCGGVCGGGQWKHTDGKQRRTDQPTCKKIKYYRELN